MRKYTFITLAIICLVMTGCVIGKTAQLLDSRLGQMSYEEALQRFGPPAQCAEAGSTRACLWSSGGGGTLIAPVGKMLVALPRHPNTAKLVFTNDRLTHWELQGNWE